MDSRTYQSAGVDIEQAESFVRRLKASSGRPGHGQMWKAAGGYAAVSPVAGERAVATTCDGVGTKLLLTIQLGRYDTIGVDLVAMCVNDLICVGATPTLFLDYIAFGRLDGTIADQVIAGIVSGCDQAGMILAGGETAEMPDVYQGGHYDLAGFAIGQVDRAQLITGEEIRPGQSLIGIASSGIHSNGLSLARKVLPDDQETLEKLLLPTLIYAQPVVEIINSKPGIVKGLAHITGGGWRNLFRLNPSVGYHVSSPLDVPPVLQAIANSVPEEEMYKTFNMGMGLCIITEHPELVLETFGKAGFTAKLVGSTTAEPQKLTLKGSSITLRG